MNLIFALALAWLVGGVIVAALWPHSRSRQPDLGLILPLGMIIGLGVTSVIFFAASLVTHRPAGVAAIVEIALVLVVGANLARRLRSPHSAHATAAPAAPWTWLQWALATVFLQTLVIGAIVAWRAFATEPLGGWDGWAIWNLQARFMIRGGTAWPELLATPELSWVHPDYPKLVSASVARLWSWTGTESAAAAGLVSIAFAAALVGVLVGAVTRLRNRTAALQTGILLVSTPFFLSFAPNQHADIPLASCMLAAVALVALGECWLLAGLCAGFAAWTKNEGLLFAVVFAVVVGWRAWRSGAHRATLSLFGGLALALGPVLYLKLALAPPNDLLAAPLGPRLSQLIEGARHRVILEALWRDVRGFGEWRLTPFIAMALPFVAWRARRRLSAGATAIPIVLGAMLLGFYSVYLLTPQDLVWHLTTSLVRLLLQLWPLALLGWGLTLPLFEPVGPRTPPPSINTALAFVGINALAAGALVLVLSGQLAANEFAAKRDRTGTTRITLGDGWHGREHHGRDTWAWSGGRATLDVQNTANGTPSPLTLRFTLRILHSRTVTLRLGPRVLWERTGPDALVPVEITGLQVPPGLSTLELTTDEPPTPESSAPGARPLAFALYNLTLR